MERARPAIQQSEAVALDGQRSEPKLIAMFGSSSSLQREAPSPRGQQGVTG